MKQIISWIENRLVRIIVALSVVGLAYFISYALGFDNGLQAQALSPKETTDAVNNTESQFRENDQQKVNQLFEEYKKPQTAPETTQKIGETITKPQKAVKRNLESAADAVQDTLDSETNSSKTK